MEKYNWYKIKLEERKETFYGEPFNWFYFKNNDISGDLLRVRNAHLIEALNEKIGCKIPVLPMFVKGV